MILYTLNQTLITWSASWKIAIVLMKMKVTVMKLRLRKSQMYTNLRWCQLLITVRNCLKCALTNKHQIYINREYDWIIGRYTITGQKFWWLLEFLAGLQFSGYWFVNVLRQTNICGLLGRIKRFYKNNSFANYNSFMSSALETSNSIFKYWITVVEVLKAGEVASCSYIYFWACNHFFSGINCSFLFDEVCLFLFKCVSAASY